MVVQEQAGTDHPGGAQVRAVGQDETHGFDDVRCLAQQHLALGECFAHQAKLVVLEVAQATVNQLAAGRGRMAGQIVLFAKEHRKAAPRRIGGDTHAIDAATNNREVIDFGQRRAGQGGMRHGADSGLRSWALFRKLNSNINVHIRKC
ncbi:hypothetical protein D9M71_574890 [compost metagenome]